MVARDAEGMAIAEAAVPQRFALPQKGVDGVQPGRARLVIGFLERQRCLVGVVKATELGAGRRF